MKQPAKTKKMPGSTTGTPGRKKRRTGAASADFYTKPDELLKIIDNISEGFIALDKEWRFSYVNGMAEKLMGMKHGDLLGKNLWDVFSAAVGTRFEQECLRAAAGEEREFENLYEPWGRWFHNRCLPRDGGGVSVYFLDITGRKKAEEGLCESEERLALALDAAQLGVFEGDMPHKKIIWSARNEVLWGFKPGEFDGTYEMFAQRVHPDDRRVISEKINHCIAKRAPFCCEFRILWPDGNTRWIACLGRFFYDSANRLLRMSGVTMDITERKEAEESLRESQSRLEAVFTAIPDVIMEYDTTLRVIRANTAATLHYGSSPVNLTREEIIARITVTHPDGSPILPHERILPRVLRGESFSNLEYLMTRADGISRHMLVSLEPVYKNGQPTTAIALWRDITELTASRKSLQESEERFSLAMQGANDGLWDWAMTTDELYYSPRWKSMLGYEEHEIGTGLEEVVDRLHPGDRERVLKRVADFQAGKKRTYEIEFRMRHKDGHYVDILSRALGVRDASGKVVRAVGTHVDFTMPKAAVEALRRSEQNYRTLVENNPDIICRYDRRHRLIFLNSAGYDITGRTPETLGKNAREQGFPPDLCALREEYLDRVFSGESVKHAYTITDNITDPRGRVRFISEFFIPEYGPDGNIETVLSISRDLTELNEASKALKESEERFRAFMDNSPAIAWAKDGQGRYVYLNRTFSDRFNVRFDDWRGKTDFELWPPEIAKQFRKSDQAVLESGEAVQVEEKSANADGTVSTWWAFKFPYRDSKGNLYIGGMGIDTTERKQAEELIRELNASLERKVQERTDELALANAALKSKNAEMERFTFTVSHDLRSPLVTIKTFLGQLFQDQAQCNAENIRQDLDFIHSATEKMGVMLDDLLNFSRIGRESFHASEMTLQEIAQEALSIVAGRISRGGIRVEVAQEPVMLQGDRTQLLQVLQNLIDNAAKYMGSRSEPLIEIGTGTAPGGEQALFVRDNGMGFDPRHKDKLFGIFEKLHADSEGTGIGLALVKRIIEVHGGSVWAESEGPGRGACFWFTLPGNKLNLN